MWREIPVFTGTVHIPQWGTPSLHKSAEGTGLTAMQAGVVRGSVSSLRLPCPHTLLPTLKKARLFLT